MSVLGFIMKIADLTRILENATIGLKSNFDLTHI